MFTRNKTHTMILVCAADDFRKHQKMWKMIFLFLKKPLKYVISKNSSIWCFLFKSARWVCYHLDINLIKTAIKMLQKVEFCIFEPKNCDVIENSSKTLLNFSPLKCTYLGKNSFQYLEHLIRKMQLKSGHL